MFQTQYIENVFGHRIVRASIKYRPLVLCFQLFARIIITSME